MEILFITRLHSSRMRSIRSSSCLLGGGGLLPGGSAPEGVSSRGGGVPACTEADPSCGQTDRCKNITFANSLRTVITLQRRQEVVITLVRLLRSNQ